MSISDELQGSSYLGLTSSLPRGQAFYNFTWKTHKPSSSPSLSIAGSSDVLASSQSLPISSSFSFASSSLLPFLVPRVNYILVFSFHPRFITFRLFVPIQIQGLCQRAPLSSLLRSSLVYCVGPQTLRYLSDRIASLNSTEVCFGSLILWTWLKYLVSFSVFFQILIIPETLFSV